MFRTFAWLLVLILACILTACISGRSSPAAFDKPVQFKSLQQAASVDITTLSVARWEDYAAALQAQFPITAASAYGLAVPLTSVSQNSVSQSLNAGLQIGFSTSKGSGASTNPATPSSALVPQTTAAPSGVAVPSESIQTDPILAYTAASAIYQEVELLNRYIEDAALRFGYVPYVARVQVSAMPFARNESYDLDLGLFSRCFGRDSQTSPAFVVPLLVTDDIERGQAQQSSQDIAQQLALPVAGSVHSLGLGGSINNLQDQVRAALSSNLNSLFMVASGASDNVLEVHFGAASNPTLNARYAMLSQTHNVTFVVLVRQQDAALEDGACAPSLSDKKISNWKDRPWDSGPVVDVVSVAHLRNANTGTEIISKPGAALAKTRKVIERFTSDKLEDRISDGTLESLLTLVEGGSGANLRELQAPLPTTLNLNYDKAQALWTELANSASYSEFRTIHFNLPLPTEHNYSQLQSVFVEDNCKDTANVTISGPGDLAPGQYTAEMVVPGSGIDYYIPATKLAQATSGAPWILTFSSLRGVAREVDSIASACATSAVSPPPPTQLAGAQ
jgi:hypothetical protein